MLRYFLGVFQRVLDPVKVAFLSNVFRKVESEDYEDQVYILHTYQMFLVRKVVGGGTNKSTYHRHTGPYCGLVCFYKCLSSPVLFHALLLRFLRDSHLFYSTVV